MTAPHVPGIEIEGELGCGAHSVVYFGRQGFAQCAVKLPRTKARWTRWIYREAVALARVKHASLPAVLEVGDVDGLPYLVMELVKGETLADVLARGRLDEDAAIAIGRQLADVLTAVHDAGLVHRDVKPRNIVLERASGVLKLVDFGFATPMERVGTADAAGTAAYAAPEQLSPPVRVDARTDLFAVGRVLLECLTGSTGGGSRALDPRATLVSHGVAPDLAEIVAGLVREDPDARYPDAPALAADLGRLVGGAPVLGPLAYEPTTKVSCDAYPAELQKILATCREARGAVVTVTAARGAGKTRLLKALGAATTELAATIPIACQKHDPPLSALRQLLDAYCERLLATRHGSAKVTADELRALIGNLAPVARLVSPARVAELVDGDSPSELAGAHDALAEGAAEILVRLSSRLGPTVVSIDDAQWMDAASVDAIARFGHRAAEAKVVIVLATRPDARDGHLAQFGRVRRSVTIELPRLSKEQVHLLVSSHLATEADASLVSRIHTMASGTPLGVFEVLGAFLDAGALRPHARAWTFDTNMSDRVELPHGSIAMLGRRVGELPAATRRVLETAAVIGTSFDDTLLARAVDVSTEDLGYATAQSRRAGLIDRGGLGGHRFVHDSLREVLVDDLADHERRRLNQRIAEVIEEQRPLSFEELCSAARHFADGETEKDPARWYRVARAAGAAALARFDNEKAIELYDQARDAAERAGIALDTSFFVDIGEAHLRIGALDESLEAFEAALERASDASVRAEVLGRLSWVYQTRAEPEKAWEKLGGAFAALGKRMPVEDIGSAAVTSAHLARGRVGRLLQRRSSSTPDTVDLLCQLHYQNARLGLEYAKPARLIQSSLECVELGERGGSPGMRARSRAFYALVVTALGRREAGAREIAQAKQIAAAHGDAATMAFCSELHATTNTWAGELDEALVVSRECVDVHGPWFELNEYCQVVSSAETIQTLRGRADEAWQWIEHAIERLRRSPTRPVIADFLIQRVRGALAAIGREVTDDPWLTKQLASVAPGDPGRGYHRLAAWGPCARYYVENGNLGDDLEQLVRKFEAEGHNPKSVHLVVSEYYTCIAHARIHQCLRAEPRERTRRVAALKKAAADLRASAKVPLLKAHRFAVDGVLAWLEGDERKAKKLLAEGEAIANQQSSPWALYCIARTRAHMLREAGREAAARDQARVAELFAHRHGAVTRTRWIREEFGLVDAAASTPTLLRSSRSSSSRTNRQLAALINVAQAPRRDLRTEQQAGRILDELMGSIPAAAGAIWFQPEPNTSGTAVLRQRLHDVSVSIAADSAHGILLRTVHRSARPWPSLEGQPTSAEIPFDPRLVIAVPLTLYEKPVGALCLERTKEDRPFTTDDRALLELLSHQVPITLEIARLLFEREQLQTSLQQAKKMEAMGQLAGGLAHDFNNMLAAMKVALSAARERAGLDAELTIELDIISQATTRAAQLTSQLLSFSRHQPVPVAVHDVNQLVATLEPMLRRVVGSKVTIVTNLSHSVDAVEVDQGSFDQALVNLLINARDAMPNGGTLTVGTRNVILGEAAAQHVNLTAGEYVEVEVADTGEGMSAETLARIFEPFFTTKPTGSGSGLGLSMVYAFARNCGGGISVSSELGVGTQFRVYLKRVGERRPVRPLRAIGSPSASNAIVASTTATTIVTHDGPDTILVVDDDDLVRRSIAKILERHGYRVLAASGSVEALDVAREHGARIGLVILDVLMPGVTGPELGRRLNDLNLSAKLLFVSGFAPESIPIEEAQVASEMLLQKPFSQTALLERVRQLMHH
jgi:signal transduction histidine kinase